MSSALGGGNFLSSIMSLVGGAFGGPIGAMIGQMFGQIASQAINQATEEFGKENGFSDTQINQAKETFRQAAGGNADDASGADDTMKAIRDTATPEQFREVNDTMDELRQNVKKAYNEAMNDAAGGSSSARSKGKGAGGGNGDFFTAMAYALGMALQSQADKVKDLSNQLADAVGKANGIDTVKNGKVDEEAKQQKDKADKEIMLLQTQVSSESSRLSFMTQGCQTALAKIGEALTTLGRSQA